MTFPRSTVTLQDGALGLAAPETDGIVAVLGYCTDGVADTLYDFSNASPSEVKSTLGKGRLAQMVASLMATPNHGPVIAIPLASTAGTNSAVSESGTGPAITLSGTPHDDYRGKIRFVQGGARGTATFQFSLDNGTNWSAETVTAATYAIPDTGLTINFATGSDYETSKTASWTSTAPTHSNTQISSALDALKESGRDVGVIGILAANSGATDSDRATAMAATFAAISTKLASLEASYRYTVAVMEAPSPVATDAAGLAAWRSALITAGAALSEKRLVVAAGYCTKASDLDALSYRRSSIFPVLERLSQAPISEDLGRVLSGTIRGVTSIEHDEEASNALDTFRYTTLRRVSGRQGFFVTQGNTFASSGSDYSLVQMVRVINAASKTARNKGLDYLNESTVADATTGKIREAEALVIDSDITDVLEAVLAGHVSGVQARVSRNSDLRTNGRIEIEVLLQPLLYMKDVALVLGFTRSFAAAA